MRRSNPSEFDYVFDVDFSASSKESKKKTKSSPGVSGMAIVLLQ